MTKSLLILFVFQSLCLLLSLSSAAQVIESAGPSRYYDYNNQIKVGIISFRVFSNDGTIKYKEHKEDTYVTLDIDQVKSFAWSIDSFVGLKNIKSLGVFDKIILTPKAFVQVITTGRMNLYLYKISDERRASPSGMAPDPGASAKSVYIIENSEGDRAYVFSNKKNKKYKEELIEFFKDDAIITDRINHNEYPFWGIPKLVKDYNKMHL